MQVKRYIALDMRRALQLVREDLGAEAVILSNKKTSEGVEVIASPHSKEELLDKWGHHSVIEAMSKDKVNASDSVKNLLNKAQKKPQKSPEIMNKSSVRNALEKSPVESTKLMISEAVPENYRSFHLATDEISTLKEEIDLLKDLLKTQMTQVGWGSFNYSQPVTSYLFKQISILGFSVDIAFDWLEQVNSYADLQQAWNETVKYLTEKIPILSVPFSQSSCRAIALVGPAGAGKTTTLIKLAAQHILEKGKESIAIVTTDTYRIGAQEQLQALGRIMEVPVKVVNNSLALDLALKEFSEKSLILVDTAGLTQNDSGWQEQYHILKTQEDKLRTLLVLPSSAQELVLQRVISHFGNVKLDGCVVTKLDESSSVGEIISLAIKNKLPIAYVTDGLSIPEDIHLANATSIMRHAINLAKLKNVEEKTMIHLFENYLSQESKGKEFLGV